MEKVLKEVRSGELLSVLALGRDIERVPEPFSGQSSLHLEISFDEFVKLCKDIGMYGENLLSYSSESLQQLCKLHISGDVDATRKLRGIFMREISYGVMKELCYSEMHGKGATKIRHKFNHSKVSLIDDHSLKQIAKVPSTVASARELLNHVNARGYFFMRDISDRNLHEYIYAMVLYAYSSKLVFNVQ